MTRKKIKNFYESKRSSTIILKNGRYDYDRKSVYAFLNRDCPRKTVIYARVSTHKQKPDLENQLQLLKTYAIMNGYTIGTVYQDIGSGISFEKRKEFFQMLDEIISGQIATVLIAYKDRLSRVGFELFKHLFAKFGCEIIITSEVGSTKLDSSEVFEEIVSLLHCYSMKLYSSRKKKKIQELLKTE